MLRNYKDPVVSEGTSFKLPDLCIVMNDYIANHQTALWSQVLRERHIPSLFTAPASVPSHSDLNEFSALHIGEVVGKLLYHAHKLCAPFPLPVEDFGNFIPINTWLPGALEKWPFMPPGNAHVPVTRTVNLDEDKEWAIHRQVHSDEIFYSPLPIGSQS
ncbi:hypothetical protein B0H10DRAFT_1955633 [Mycena sp. CBHHK59/15]|nr:hypothetical protein B0H10DRAFT_1955633 [Mycena sp. CBHHK59/15]